MKKLVVALSICMIGQSAVVAHAGTHKKHKRMRHHHAVRHHQEEWKKETLTVAAPNTPVANNESDVFFSRLNGTFDIASNYVFRGISQTRNNPAVQGGLTYTFPVGVYFNVWGSNVDFVAPDEAQSRATLEIDTIVGLRRSIGDDFTYDINVARYNYPRARYANYNEINSLFKYKIFQVGISYSANVYNVHTTGTYTNAALIFDIPCRYAFNIQDLSFQAGIGHYSLGRPAGNSYNDYNASLTKKLNNTYAIMVQWTGTNGRAQVPPNDDNQIIGMVTASF